MRLAVTLPGISAPPAELREFAKAADDLGFHSLWTDETWRSDAFVLLASLAEHTSQAGLGTAVSGIFSRSPSMIAQSAATLDVVSDGRAILGLGTSDPSFVEGWHGLAFDQPVRRMRETIDIVRMLLRGEKPKYDGQIFSLASDFTMAPRRPNLPIVVAALGPRNLAQTAELADGWLPYFWSPAKAEVFRRHLEDGRARRDRTLPALEVMPLMPLCITDRPHEIRQAVKPSFAYFIGGAGSSERSFYSLLYRRYGYEQEADSIEALVREEGIANAAQGVTDEMVDDVTIFGPASHVKERLQACEQAGATVTIVDLAVDDHRERLRMLEQVAALAPPH